MPKSLLLFIELARPVTTASSLTSEQSWLLTTSTGYHYDRLWVSGVPGMSKSPELGRIFSELVPTPEGDFEIELGVCMPDFFPTIEGSFDYAVSVLLNGQSYEVCVSNQMKQIHLPGEEGTYFRVFPLFAEEQLRANPKLKLGTAPATHLRSVATMRFRVAGRDAEDALESGIDRCIDILVRCLNRLLAGFQSADSNLYSYQSLLYSPSALGAYFVLMRGSNPDRLATARFAPNAGKVAFMPPDLDAATKELLTAFLGEDQNVVHPKQFLVSAKIASQAGLLQLALLQSVIAAETATAAFVKGKLLGAGVSNTKWDQMKADVTYSQMLNLYLFALAPPTLKPDSSLLGTLNRARGLRNLVMHEGYADLRQNEIEKIIEDSRRFMEYLTRIETEAG